MMAPSNCQLSPCYQYFLLTSSNVNRSNISDLLRVGDSIRDVTVIVHDLATRSWFLQHSSMFENRIRSKALVVNTKVGGVPLVRVWKIDIATSCLFLNLRTDQDIVAEKVLVVDESLVGVEEACIKGIGNELGESVK